MSSYGLGTGRGADLRPSDDPVHRWPFRRRLARRAGSRRAPPTVGAGREETDPAAWKPPCGAADRRIRGPREPAVTSLRDTPDDGRPSLEARARLADELHEQLASSRLAWEAALLRSDAALAEGDAAEVQAALDEHRLLLGALEERLGALVAGATADRDLQAPSPDPAPAALPRATSERASPARRGASALLGAAAAVLLVAGVLATDLPLEDRGLVAGTEAPEADDALRTRPASERIDGARTPPTGETLDAPPGVLPGDAGDAPAASTRSQPDPAPARGATDRTVPEEDVAASDTDAPPAHDAAADPITGPDRRRADAPSADELTRSLPSRDGGEGHDVPTALPDTLAELPEDAVPPATSPVTSEATPGLG